MAPPFPDNVERWGINDMMFLRYFGQFDNWTRWFDIHSPEHIISKRPQAWEWYIQQKKPIYMPQVDPSIPHSITYPTDHIIQTFNTKRFASTFDWAIAKAIDEKFEQIELVWCGMRHDTERTNQVKHTTYWIGRAEQAGIQVIIHGDSYLQPPVQPYSLSL